MIKSDRDYSSHRFLIADDKPFLRNLIHSMLSRCKAGAIMHANDGAAAIDILADKTSAIDCVLCDWNMTPMDGLELLRSIRAGNTANAPRDLRFIMLTGHGDSEIVDAAMRMDTNGYVVKPVAMEKLIRAIDNAFAKPVKLKREEFYLAESTVDLPDSVLVAPTKHIPSWVLLSSMQEKTKAAISGHFELIQREGRNPLGRTRPLINREWLDIDRVAPGRILAEDIYTEQGTLLLAAGMVLSQSLLKRLRELAALSSESIRFAVGDHES